MSVLQEIAFPRPPKKHRMPTDTPLLSEIPLQVIFCGRGSTKSGEFTFPAAIFTDLRGRGTEVGRSLGPQSNLEAINQSSPLPQVDRQIGCGRGGGREEGGNADTRRFPALSFLRRIEIAHCGGRSAEEEEKGERKEEEEKRELTIQFIRKASTSGFRPLDPSSASRSQGGGRGRFFFLFFLWASLFSFPTFEIRGPLPKNSGRVRKLCLLSFGWRKQTAEKKFCFSSSPSPVK